MPKKMLEGRVISDASNKTVVVLVKEKKMDRIYKKFVNVRNKYHAHDENNEFKAGDSVVIEESRPISKLKKWTVLKKVEDLKR